MRLLLLVLWLYLGAILGVFLERALFRWAPSARWLDLHTYPLGVGEPWSSMALAFLLCLTVSVAFFFVLWNLFISPRMSKR